MFLCLKVNPPFILKEEKVERMGLYAVKFAGLEFLLDAFYFLGKLRGQDICFGHEMGGEVKKAGV